MRGSTRDGGAPIRMMWCSGLSLGIIAVAAVAGVLCAFNVRMVLEHEDAIVTIENGLPVTVDVFDAEYLIADDLARGQRETYAVRKSTTP